MSTNVEAFDLPQLNVARNDEAEQQHHQQEIVASQPQTAAHPVQQPVRDPADVRTILSMAMAGIVLIGLTLLMAGVLAYKVLSSPPLIVVDRTKEGDRVVSMDGQELVGGVFVSKDKPGDGDKKAAANTFASNLYKIDPATRADDLEHALKMMVPTAAIELMKQLKPDLERQRAERWQTIWEPQVTSIDPADPYTVRVVGRQRITRVVKNELKQDSRQLAFNLKLVFDSQRRVERNNRTGFLIADLRDFQIIAATPDQFDPTVAVQPIPAGTAEQMPQPGQFVMPQP